MRRAAILALLLALAACSPPPRAASYFKAHPDEDAQVVTDCATGTHRGVECTNAQTAAGQIKSAQRLNLYKKNF